MADALLTLAILYFTLLNLALPLAALFCGIAIALELFTKKYHGRLPVWVLATSTISPVVSMLIILPISYLSVEAFQVLPWLMPFVTWVCQLIGFVACVCFLGGKPSEPIV